MRSSRVLPLLAWAACEIENPIPQRPIDFDDIPTAPPGVGDRCKTDFDCQAPEVVRDRLPPRGLVCGGDGTCQPSGAGDCAGEGEARRCDACLINAECAAGHGCTPCLGGAADLCVDEKGRRRPLQAGVCLPGGAGTDGTPCTLDAECGRGQDGTPLHCALSGLAGTCRAAGTGDWGDPCTMSASGAECFPGLRCGPTATAQDPSKLTCQPPALAFPPYGGVTCPDDGGAFRVYFEVATQNDFYRLPFPNDARVAGGRIDLSNHPTPGGGVLGADLVRAYLDALEEDFAGFSPIGSILFRFSKRVDAASLQQDRDAGIDPVRVVDLTEPAGGVSLNWQVNNGARNFICQQWIAITPRAPLRPGHTYAALLMDDIRSCGACGEGQSGCCGSEAPAQDADFAALLADAAPGDGRLTAAHAAYAPLRAYLAAQAIDPATVAGATVFTVSDPTDTARRLAQVVRAAGPSPALTDVRLCGASAESPDTACACTGMVSAGYDEIHGRFSIPIVQQGTRPYLTEDQGGAIQRDASGNPVLQGSEAVCFAITVPRGAAMPQTGWPVVIYGHGTGGNFRSGVRDAGEHLAMRGIATFSFTGVMHDERRGGSDVSPDLLVFNVANPRAARDNLLQGVADLVQAVRAVQGARVAGSAGEATFDPGRIYYFGHSQGSTTGGLGVPFEPAIAATVLSGAGGHLVQTLMDKRAPFDINAALSFYLGETIYRSHPVLNLWQNFFDPSDLVHFGRPYFRAPAEGMPPRHVLTTYGLRDTFSPPSSLAAFVTALGTSVVEPLIDDFNGSFSGPPTVTAPVTANFADSAPPVTAVTLQVDPGDGDGHFVAFQDPAARARWIEFFASAVVAGTPTVP